MKHGHEWKSKARPYHLIWDYRGEMRGRHFAEWNECEAFSNRLIAAGLVPKLTEDSPCPYDEVRQ